MTGITPAHAGKTESGTFANPTGEDHPRACGKDRAFFSFLRLFLGSPPRMRERLLIASAFFQDVGITPAHAGKTDAWQTFGYRVQDHPRACGKDIFFFHSSAVVVGSPPRMRERRKRCIINFSNIGITPAHAGKTGRLFSLIMRMRDHPRACGKDTEKPKAEITHLGSPPRMRERRF